MAAITLGFSSLRAAVLCSAVVATTTLGVEASTRFQPHRAVYDLAMIDTSNRAGIDGVTGRIVYELTGSPCEGYTSRYRYYTDMRIGGKLLTNDQRSTTFESADGKRFDFLSQYFLNGQREQDLHGSASKTNDGIQVTLKKPDERDVTLGPAMFINAHLSKIIQSAKAGETILTATVYDGSDEGDELVETTTIIGKHQNSTAQGLGESEDAWQIIPDKSGWKVSVTYYNNEVIEGGGELLPGYQVSFVLHPDGISRDLTLRYEDYSLSGVLKQIELLPSKTCD